MVCRMHHPQVRRGVHNRMKLKWRLFEEKNGELHTLFHGVHGSRQIEEDLWYRANNRLVRDGTSKTWYEGGFHVFADVQGLAYLGRFKKPRKLVAVQVLVDGLRPKPTNGEVLLADWMMVPDGAMRLTVKEV